MIKIVHIITDLDTGGAEIMLYKLLSGMERSSFNNVVISIMDKGKLGNKIEGLGIQVYSLRLRRGINNLVGLRRILKILKVEKPDVIQTWLYHADLLGLIAGKIVGISTIVWNLRCSELQRKDHPRFLFWILRILARLSAIPDVVIVNSNAGKIAHEKIGYHPKRWEFIPNGFNVKTFVPSANCRVQFKKSLKLPDNAALIGMIARFNPMKDHFNFLDAAARLYKSRPDVHYILVGQFVDNKNKLLTERINSLGLNKNIHLLGIRHDIPFINAALDIACLTSYSEGFSNVIGEAMACGVPCVVTDTGDSAYIVGETGIVVPPRDHIGLAEAWDRLLSMSAEERQFMGIKARERVISLFSINKIVKMYEELYKELCSGKN